MWAATEPKKQCYVRVNEILLASVHRDLTKWIVAAEIIRGYPVCVARRGGGSDRRADADVRTTGLRETILRRKNYIHEAASLSMPNTALSDDPPPFDDVFQGEDVEQRIYGTILQTREPTTASSIAERAECDPKTARKYLRWFATLGIVKQHGGHPTTYERNDAYFEWRRTNSLASTHTVEELQERVRELTAQISTYEELYDVETPAAVNAVAAAEASDDRTIDDMYADLANWITAKEERRLYERARQQRVSTEVETVSG